LNTSIQKDTDMFLVLSSFASCSSKLISVKNTGNFCKYQQHSMTHQSVIYGIAKCDIWHLPPPPPAYILCLVQCLGTLSVLLSMKQQNNKQQLSH